jgi:hypothetical protein
MYNNVLQVIANNFHNKLEHHNVHKYYNLVKVYLLLDLFRILLLPIAIQKLTIEQYCKSEVKVFLIRKIK